MYKKIYFLSFLIFINFLSQYGNVYAESNLAYIDFQYLIKNSKAGIQIEKQINRFKENKKKEIEELKTNLIKKEQELVNKQNILSEENFNKELQNLKKEVNEFNKKEKETNELIRKEYEKLNQKLITLIEPILVDYTKKNNIQMLFLKKNLVIADNNLDITDIFMTIINNEVKLDE